MDLGAGIATASATVLLFLLLTKTKTFRDFKNLNTLNKRTTIISANLVWLLLIPGTFWYYIFRGGRGDYPPFADSLGVVIFASIPIILFMLIPLNIFYSFNNIQSELADKTYRESRYLPQKCNLAGSIFQLLAVSKSFVLHYFCGGRRSHIDYSKPIFYIHPFDFAGRPN